MIKYVDYDIIFQEIPEEVTLAINLSCCPNDCTGCHSQWLMKEEGEELTKEVLYNLISKYKSSITCVCFMGGDNDPQAIVRLALVVRKLGLKVGWYSGRDLLPDPLTTFNYVKLGAYVEDLGPLTSPSTNQCLLKIENQGIITDITHKFWKKS